MRLKVILGIICVVIIITIFIVIYRPEYFFGGFGLLIIVIAFVWWFPVISILRHGQPTIARVIDFKKYVDADDIITWSHVLEYIVNEVKYSGESVIAETFTKLEEPKYNLEERHKIIYDVHNPEKYLMADSVKIINRRMLYVIAVGVGLILLGFYSEKVYEVYLHLLFGTCHSGFYLCLLSRRYPMEQRLKEAFGNDPHFNTIVPTCTTDL